MKRSSGSGDGPAKRAQVERKLMAKTSVPKSHIGKILSILREEGMLADHAEWTDDAEHNRKSLRKSLEDNSAIRTPYGPLVQTMMVPTQPPFEWHFVHPMALLYQLCLISEAFMHIMSCLADKGDAKIILYVDEYRPGNVFRPDKGRAAQNIFWVFSGWPQWLLARSQAWMIFGTFRSAKLPTLPGGVSALMARVLEKFFGPVDPSFSRGLALPNGRLLACSFGGFLGDEKGLKDTLAPNIPIACPRPRLCPCLQKGGG